MNILVLSPHRDDAAFSLALSIRHWLSVGHTVSIQNVFTHSDYAPYAVMERMPKGQQASYVSRLRQREDAAFLKYMGPGVSMSDLCLEDAPVRLRCESHQVCELNVRPDDLAISKIQQTVSAFIRSNPDAALVLPLGLGHHVDHSTARDASLKHSRVMPCAFYEDLPYATRRGVQIDLRRFRQDTDERLHVPLYPVLCHGTHTRPVEWKKRLAMLYASQIDEGLAEEIAAFSRRYHGAERLWANETWIAVAARQKLSTSQRNPEAEPLPA